MKMWTKISNFEYLRIKPLWCGFAFILFLYPSLPVQADANLDPFQNDSMQWMSFDRYKDELKHGKTYEPQPSPHAEPTEVPHYLNGNEAVSTDGKPAIASPTRALNPPLMPGMNKGFEVHISTTEDNKPQAAQIMHLEGNPILQIAKNWETAAEAARKAKRKGPTDEDEPTPLDVRMSFLPSSKTTPVPSINGPFSHGRPPNAISLANSQKENVVDPAAADFAAWSAAIEAYKKRQLAAIQSDRQTLTALKAAISDLGLQKQLDFMPGTNSAVSAQVDMPSNMDVPGASLTAPTNN